MTNLQHLRDVMVRDSVRIYQTASSGPQRVIVLGYQTGFGRYYVNVYPEGGTPEQWFRVRAESLSVPDA